MKLKYVVTQYESAGLFTTMLFRNFIPAWLYMLGGRLQGKNVAIRRYR